jgi:hypothetical protein
VGGAQTVQLSGQYFAALRPASLGYVSRLAAVI